MLPLRDANPTRHRAWLTMVLIAANLGAFLFWQPSIGGSQEDAIVFNYCNAMTPWEVSHQSNFADGGVEAAAALEQTGLGDGGAIQEFLQQECPAKSWLLSVFASMFLHAGWLHLGGNMLFLWIFGNNVEDRLRPPAFLVFYLAGGVSAAALQILFGPDSPIPNVGASGAVAAVLGAYLVLYPHARVVTAVFFFFITVVELPAVVVLGFWFVLQLFSGVGTLGGSVAGGGVAYWAHVGGFVAGALMALAMFGRRRVRPVRPPDPYGRPF